MGTSVRSAMLESIKQGDSLAKTLRTGLGAAVSNVQAKFKGMGAATKSVATDIGNAFKHPIQTIKATLGKALNGAEEDARGLGTQADDTGRRLDDMGKKGAGAGENLVGVLKKVAAAARALPSSRKASKRSKSSAAQPSTLRPMRRKQTPSLRPYSKALRTPQTPGPRTSRPLRTAAKTK